MVKAMAVGVGLSVLSCAALPYQYFYDDGTLEVHAPLFPPTGVGSFFNEFQTVSGAEIITSVSIMFASGNGFLPNGHPLSIRIWSDPNGDGSPFDAVLVSSSNHALQGAGSGHFVEYDVPDVVFSPGARFFAGMSAAIPNNSFWGPFDTAEPHHNKGFMCNSMGPFNGGNTLLVDWGDLMVRANASPVPEPGTMAAFGLPIMGWALRKRRRRLGG